MATPTLSRGGLKVVHSAVDKVFEKLKYRVLGPDYVKSRTDKQILVGFRPELSIPGIYRLAAAEEGAKPDENVLHGVTKVVESYLDAQKEATKAKVVNAVNSWLAETARKKIKTSVETILGGQLAEVWGKVTKDITRIIDTESTGARNLGTSEGIVRIAAAYGESDPSVFFVVVRDLELCDECERLHLTDHEGTLIPKVWKLSEVASGYHKRGDATPSMGGLHPHCRCTIAYLSKGYGFDRGGRVRFVGLDHDEYLRQHA